MFARLRSLGGQLWGPLARLSWIAREAVTGQVGTAVKIGLLGLIAGASQGVSVGLIALFAEQMTSAADGRVTFLGVTLASDTAVLLAAFGLLSVLLTNAVSTYGAEVLGRRLGRNLHQGLARRIVGVFPDLHRVGRLRRVEPGELVQNVMQRCRVAGITFEALARSVPRILQLLVAAGILLLVNWKLTLIVSPLIALALPVFHRFSHHVRSRSREFFDSAPKGLRAGLGELLDEAESAMFVPEDPESYRLRFDREPRVARYFAVFDDILLSGERAALVSSVVRAVVVSSAVGIFGWWASRGDQSWGELTAYAAAALLFLGHLQALAQVATVLNRFDPQIALYLELMADVERARNLPPARVDASRAPAIDLEPGTVICLAATAPLGRNRLSEVLTPLERCSGRPLLDSVAFATRSAGSFRSLRETQASQLPEGESAEPGGGDATADAIAVATALSKSAVPVVLLEDKLIADAPAECLEPLRRAHCVVVAGFPAVEDLDLDATFIVTDLDGEILSGDLAWYRAEGSAIAKQRQPEASSSHGAVLDFDDF